MLTDCRQKGLLTKGYAVIINVNRYRRMRQMYRRSNRIRITLLLYWRIKLTSLGWVCRCQDCSGSVSMQQYLSCSNGAGYGEIDSYIQVGPQPSACTSTCFVWLSADAPPGARANPRRGGEESTSTRLHPYTYKRLVWRVCLSRSATEHSCPSVMYSQYPEISFGLLAVTSRGTH
jgi:hypothetical protein